MSTDIAQNNNRIAKNTLVLYIRMVFLLIISLFTSRVFLNALGVVDFGINNAVGGFVSLFVIITGTLNSSVSRFLTFALGKNDEDYLNKVFSTSINIMLFFSFILLVLGETIGLWFLNYKMNIPTDRMTAANWLFQSSLLVMVLGMLQNPYTSVITAHEKMNVYAYMSILGAVLKLIIVYALYLSHGDNLIFYAVLLFLSTLITSVIYWGYCKHKFAECHYSFVYDKPLLKEFTIFTGWNAFGSFVGVITSHGINLLINLFYGVTVNTARGIAEQVNGAVNQLLGNFTSSIQPPITKSYASGNMAYMHTLVYSGAKLCYFVMLLPMIPICIETSTVLNLWLGQVPDYAVVFVRCSLIMSIITSISYTILVGGRASGQIKKYNVYTSLLWFMVFPCSYIAFKLGYGPTSTYYISIIDYLLMMLLRLYLIKDLISISFWEYVNKVYIRIIIVTLPSFLIPSTLVLIIQPSVVRFLAVTFISLMTTFIFVYFWGLTFGEKQMVRNIIRKSICSITRMSS